MNFVLYIKLLHNYYKKHHIKDNSCVRFRTAPHRTAPHRNNNLKTVARVPTRGAYIYTESTYCHSEHREESKSISHKRGFVHSHDKYTKTNIAALTILVRLKPDLQHPITLYYLAALLRKAVFFAFWR